MNTLPMIRNSIADDVVSEDEKTTPEWQQLPGDIQAKYSAWRKPRLLTTKTKIGKQWTACLSDVGYTTTKHSNLYPKDGTPKQCVSKVLHTACGIANTLSGIVETIGEGAKLKARVVEIDNSELPPKN